MNEIECNCRGFLSEYLPDPRCKYHGDKPTIARLRALLKSVEYAGDFCDGPACPVCLSAPHQKHTPDCALAAEIR